MTFASQSALWANEAPNGNNRLTAYEIPQCDKGGAFDHYLFYKLNSKSKKHGYKYRKTQITLADQFAKEGEVEHFFVKNPIALGNPADKNGEGIVDPETHMVAYRIFPNFLKNLFKGKKHLFRKLPKVTVTNQLGEMTLKLWDPPNLLLVPSAKSLESPVDPPEDPPSRSLSMLCYP